MRDLACERVWRGVDWSELGVAGAGHPGHAGPHGAGEGDSVDTGVDIILSRHPPGHHVVRAELVRARLRRARRVGGPGGGAVRPGLGAGLARRAAQTGRSVQILLENILYYC